MDCEYTIETFTVAESTEDGTTLRTISVLGVWWYGANTPPELYPYRNPRRAGDIAESVGCRKVDRPLNLTNADCQRLLGRLRGEFFGFVTALHTKH